MLLGELDESVGDIMPSVGLPVRRSTLGEKAALELLLVIGGCGLALEI